MVDSPRGEKERERAPDRRWSRTAYIALRGNDLVVAPEVSSERGPVAPTDLDALRECLAAAVTDGQLVYDERRGGYRTLPIAYRAIRERLDRAHYDVSLGFDPAPRLPYSVDVRQQPRPYQTAALDRWASAGHRGIVVLPTGAGKTLVALLGIAALGVAALVVVPTLDLLEQWRRALVDVLGAPAHGVATYGGGKRDLAPLTVTTYDSATIHTDVLNQFGLLVFDEVHHLPATSYRRAAEGAAAPYRLGLSATPERTDGRESDLTTLVGPLVFVRSAAGLRRYLAPFQEHRIPVTLSGEETARYRAARTTYREYLRRRRLRITSPEEFQRRVVWPSATDPDARTAMLAHAEARRLSFNAAGKLRVLADLLRRHAADRVIIFSEFNNVVDDVSRDLLIPSITHRTPAAERAAVLDGFRSGRFTKLVTGRVLNEGVDVPDANVAIVLSGSATRREYVQRLGRVLRPKAGPAILYELVSEETGEEHVTRRRHVASAAPSFE